MNRFNVDDGPYLLVLEAKVLADRDPNMDDAKRRELGKQAACMAKSEVHLGPDVDEFAALTQMRPGNRKLRQSAWRRFNFEVSLMKAAIYSRFSTNRRNEK